MKKRSTTPLKIAAIIVVLCLALFARRDMIQAVWQDNSLSRPQAMLTIAQKLLNIPQNKPQDNQSHVIQSGANQEPHQVAANVAASPIYQKAARTAQAFNQGLDLNGLNQAFVNQVNQHRSQLGWPEIQVGHQLATGSQTRVRQLSDYYYLSSRTLEGQDFRTAHPAIEDANSRLGESTFELYIAADDVHLDTWRQHPDILADYLYKAFAKMEGQETSAYIASQYVTLYAQPSDQLIGDVAYVRLVAVVTSDTLTSP